MDSKGSLKVGVLTPLPCYRTTAQSIDGLGAITIPYHLCEEDGWELRVEELHRALESAKGICKPVAVYITNPGNPAGKRKELIFTCIGASMSVYSLFLAVMFCHFGFRSDSKQKIDTGGDPVCL